MNVLLVGEESAGIQVLRLVAEAGHRLVGVLTAPRTRGGGATVAGVAEQLGLLVLPSERVRDPELASWIRRNEVDVLLNVHSLFVIHADVVAAPAIGSFNLHPGPLPEYAGLNVPSWSIYHGERIHGVTLHWMEPTIDTGPIAYEQRFEMGDEETGLSLSARCVREGRPLVARLLDAAAQDRSSIRAVAQDRAVRRYFGKEVPHGGRVMWSMSARRVTAFIRACDYFPFASPWGHPTGRLGDRAVSIVKADQTGKRTRERPGTVGSVDDDGALVAAADEWVLIRRLQVDGSGVAPHELLRPGARFEERP